MIHGNAGQIQIQDRPLRTRTVSRDPECELEFNSAVSKIDLLLSMDDKALLANYSAMLAAAAAAAQNGSPGILAQFQAPSTAAANMAPVMPPPVASPQQIPPMSMSQAQYMAAILQQNDMSNLIQNALASGVPTLDVPTIFSYLGYSNSFPAHNNGFNIDQSGSGSSATTTNNGSSSSGSSSKNKNNLEAKYAKLMDVVQEIGRDVRPLYTGSKTASDRLRRQVNQARHLVRECLMEVDRRAQRSSSSSGGNQ